MTIYPNHSVSNDHPQSMAWMQMSLSQETLIQYGFIRMKCGNIWIKLKMMIFTSAPESVIALPCRTAYALRWFSDSDAKSVFRDPYDSDFDATASVAILKTYGVLG